MDILGNIEVAFNIADTVLCSTFFSNNLVVFLLQKALLMGVVLMFSLNYSDPELIYLTDGASKGVMQMLNTIIRNDKDGVQ